MEKNDFASIRKRVVVQTFKLTSSLGQTGTTIDSSARSGQGPYYFMVQFWLVVIASFGHCRLCCLISECLRQSTRRSSSARPVLLPLSRNHSFTAATKPQDIYVPQAFRVWSLGFN